MTCGSCRARQKRPQSSSTAVWDIVTSTWRPMKSPLAGSPQQRFLESVVDAADRRVLGVHMIGEGLPGPIRAYRGKQWCFVVAVRSDVRCTRCTAPQHRLRHPHQLVRGIFVFSWLTCKQRLLLNGGSPPRPASLGACIAWRNS